MSTLKGTQTFESLEAFNEYMADKDSHDATLKLSIIKKLIEINNSELAQVIKAIVEA